MAFQLSEQQQRAANNAIFPPSWSLPNPGFSPSPFNYTSSYIAPSWTSNLKGSGASSLPYFANKVSNQFTSSLTQPPGIITNGVFANSGENALADAPRGAGLPDMSKYPRFELPYKKMVRM